MQDIPLEALLELYASVGWTAYTRERHWSGPLPVQPMLWGPGKTKRWLVSAGSSAMMHPFSSAGYPRGPRPSAAIGRALLENVLDRYSHCRQKVLMTDDRPEQKAFYEALGFTRLDLREGPTLRAFVKLSS